MAIQEAPEVNPKLLVALGENWQAEKSGVRTYRTLAHREPDPIRKQKFFFLPQWIYGCRRVRCGLLAGIFWRGGG
jgi:hypothetical protein